MIPEFSLLIQNIKKGPIKVDEELSFLNNITSKIKIDDTISEIKISKNNYTIIINNKKIDIPAFIIDNCNSIDQINIYKDLFKLKKEVEKLKPKQEIVIDGSNYF